MPRGTQWQSAARLRSRSHTMSQVYVDVALARLRHAIRCCMAQKFDRQIVGPIKGSHATLMPRLVINLFSVVLKTADVLLDAQSSLTIFMRTADYFL